MSRSDTKWLLVYVWFGVLFCFSRLTLGYNPKPSLLRVGLGVYPVGSAELLILLSFSQGWLCVM